MPIASDGLIAARSLTIEPVSSAANAQSARPDQGGVGHEGDAQGAQRNQDCQPP
jgi:hypothetical protein